MQIPRRQGAASILVIMCLAVLGTIGIVGAMSSAEAAEGTTECFGCYEYEQLCPNGGHEDHTNTTAPWFTGGQIHSSCVPRGCYSDHTTQGCLETLAAIEELDRALPLLEERQWSALASLLADSRTAKLNAQRNALQFTGCGSMIAAHIPIAEDDARHLVQAITNEVNEQ